MPVLAVVCANVIGLVRSWNHALTKVAFRLHASTRVDAVIRRGLIRASRRSNERTLDSRVVAVCKSETTIGSN